MPSDFCAECIWWEGSEQGPEWEEGDLRAPPQALAGNAPWQQQQQQGLQPLAPPPQNPGPAGAVVPNVAMLRDACFHVCEGLNPLRRLGTVSISLGAVWPWNRVDRHQRPVRPAFARSEVRGAQCIVLQGLGFEVRPPAVPTLAITLYNICSMYNIQYM